MDAGSNSVHSGFWRDYDLGRIGGARLTLSNPKALALLASLAMVVTFAANRSFKIWRICLHSWFHSFEAKTDSTALAQRKRQVILRNSETAIGALLSLVSIGVSERPASSVSGRAILKSLLLKLFVAAHLLAFVALGVLTSRVGIGGTVVSRVTSTCGKWIMNEADPVDKSASTTDAWASAAMEFLNNATRDADNYVHNCYNDKSSRGFFDCTKLVSRFLPFSEEHNVSCPFERGICLAGENSAFAMDTGDISFSALGINQKHSKDLSVRRRTTCAVVDQHPFYVGLLTSDDAPTALAGNLTTFVYSFGTDSGVNITWPFHNENFTSTFDLRETAFFEDTRLTPAEILHPLNSSTIDVSIMMLRAPGVQFINAQDDPWFSAHHELDFDNYTGDVTPGRKRYAMDHTLNVLVCDERSQFCNHMTGQCTPWLGVYPDIDDLRSSLGEPLLKEDMDGYREMLISTVVVLGSIASSFIYNSIQGRGHAALQATKYYNLGTQFGLHPEQWKVELRYWFQMALARVQLEVLNSVERPNDVDPEWAHNLWGEEMSTTLCGNVKFRSANHTSLSVAGIVTIISCTALLTIISLLDHVVASKFLRRRFPNFISAWEETENLALLKQVMTNEVSVYQIHYASSLIDHTKQSWENNNMTREENGQYISKMQVTVKHEMDRQQQQQSDSLLPAR